MADTTSTDNPEAPQQTAGVVTSDTLRHDLDLILKVFHGVNAFMPAGSAKDTAGKLLAMLEMARQQDWVFDVLADLLNRFQNTSPAPEEVHQAVIAALADQGQRVREEKLAAVQQQ